MIAPVERNLTGRWAIHQGRSWNVRINWIQEEKQLFPFYTGYYMARFTVRPNDTFAYRRGNNIAFVENTPAEDTITDASSLWLTAGFEAGMKITAEGASNLENIRAFTIGTVTAGTITLASADDVVSETAARVITVQEKPLIRMSSANLLTGKVPFGLDMGNLNLGMDEFLGLHINGQDTRNLDFDHAYYELVIIPTEQETVGPLARAGIVVDVDNLCGYGTLDSSAAGGEVFADFDPGDEVQITTSTNTNEGRYTVLARGTASVGGANRRITLTDTLEGTDNAADTALVVKRLIPNWGARFCIARGTIQLKRGLWI